jgi:membrane protein
LALVPTLGAIVLSYGLIATPATVSANIQALTSIIPTDAARLIGEQLENVVNTSGGKKGLGLILALSIAIYGVTKGSSALITSLNIAYDEDETRSFVRLNLLSLALAAGGVAVAILAMIAIAAMAGFESLFPNAPWYVTLTGKLLSYAVMGGVGAAMAATVYRFGPNRRGARWAWLTPGSLFTSILWLTITLGFGLYVANFGNYDATYGSLGAVMVLLTWLYLSAYVLLLGAELNCELERQTVRDTTVGPEQPLGQRGAYAADTVTDGSEPEPKAGPGPASADTREENLQDSDEAATVPPKSAADTHVLAKKDVARAQEVRGLGKIGFVASTLASSGLILLRRKNGAFKGVIFLVAAGFLSWVGRKDEARATADRDD